VTVQPVSGDDVAEPRLDALSERRGGELLVDEPTTAPTIDRVDPSDGSRQSVHVIGRYDEPGHAIVMISLGPPRCERPARCVIHPATDHTGRPGIPSPIARRGHPGRNILKSVVSPSDELT
jgi:hypothetical protein